MALSDEDKQEIANLIRSTIADGCLCGHKANITHFFNRIEALGSGNIAKGIETATKTIGLLTGIRHLGERVGGSVAVALTVAAFMGLLALIGAGIKLWIRMIP